MTVDATDNIVSQPKSPSQDPVTVDTANNADIGGGSTPYVMPRQTGTGSTRGAQIVGHGDTVIDGNNNTISITNSTTGVTINVGVIPTTSASQIGVGLSITDSTGFTLFKLDGETWFWYDKTNKTNVMQIGLLPDGTYGMAVAKPGEDVDNAFS